MLHFVLGRAGYGKTEYCFNEIKKLIDDKADNILLITPEQYNFTAEKRLLKMLGEHNISKVENSSFSRLYNEAVRLYGGSTLPVLSKGAKGVLMKKAIDMVKDNLVLFRKKVNKSSFVNSMVNVYDEMKSCNISYDEMLSVSDSVDKKILSCKLRDMSLIIRTYETLIDNKFLDSADDLRRLYNLLDENDYLSNKYVFIDGFNGFVANEYKILELIVSKAKTVTITFATDSYGTDNAFDLFSYVNKNIVILEKICRKAGVDYNFINLEKNFRAQNDELAVCEKNAFSTAVKPFKGKPENIKIYSAKSIYDECTYIASEIKKDLKSGIRARDIAVICRDLGKYSDELIYTFKKYEIPCFDDERQPVKTQPLIIFVQYLFRCMIYSFKSDDILSLAKTSLTDLKDKDICELENYIFMWNINGVKKWSTDFENSSRGFVSDISESDSKALDRINASRKYFADILLSFKKKIKNASAIEISRAVYDTLIKFNVNVHLKELAVNLEESNLNLLAEEQERIWDSLMEILNRFAVIIGDEVLSPEEYLNYFNIMISAEDLGVLPQGIDNVQIGQADRMRADNPKSVYILGANEGEFPQNIVCNGLFSESDRIILNNNDFKLYSFGEVLNLQERYFAYMALSASSQKLTVSYMGESDSSPSPIITAIKTAFPDIREVTSRDIAEIDKIESLESAFEYMAEHFSDNTVFIASLKESLKDDSRFDAVKMLADNDDINLKDEKLSVDLFGKDMYLSASRMEDYFNCSFRYFCKYGLSAKLRTAVKMDAMQTGTVIHYVLENIISDVGSKVLSEMKSDEINSLVNKYLNKYLSVEIINGDSLSKRFIYQFTRLSNMISSVVKRLAEEFSQSDFEAKAFELSIDKDGAVKPALINLENGGTVSLKGSIDRVDVLEKNGVKFVRVVDYKSGSKMFNLSDILYGLNLQMFVYLFALCNDKDCEYSGIPAGVLYMHSSKSVLTANKNIAKESVSKNEDSEFKMKGIILYDEKHNILESMEHDLKGKYIPVKVNKSGDITGTFASLEELGRIEKKTEQLIALMGNKLHKGYINQNPINGKNHDKTCEFCDYSSVCANRRMIEKREMQELSDNEVIEILKEE